MTDIERIRWAKGVLAHGITLQSQMRPHVGRATDDSSLTPQERIADAALVLAACRRAMQGGYGWPGIAATLYVTNNDDERRECAGKVASVVVLPGTRSYNPRVPIWACLYWAGDRAAHRETMQGVAKRFQTRTETVIEVKRVCGDYLDDLLAQVQL